MSEGPSQPAGEPMPWDEFERRLAHGLATMAVESFLILSLPDDGAGLRGYLQFAHWGDKDGASAGLRIEAAGNEYLASTRPLTPAQVERLAGLAWRAPGPDDPCRNYTQEWPTPAPFADVARLTVRTLREVYGVGQPEELRSKYARFEGVDDRDLGLGLEAPERPPRTASKPPTRSTFARLGPLVEDGLQRWFGVRHLERDVDGDYPIRVGSALVFVRLIDGRPPMVVIFSSILDDIDESPALFAALNNVNRQVSYARAFWVPSRVLVATELPAVGISADQIAIACAELGHVADQLDDVFQGRFGGRLPFGGHPVLLN